MPCTLFSLARGSHFFADLVVFLDAAEDGGAEVLSVSRFLLGVPSFVLWEVTLWAGHLGSTDSPLPLC